VDVIHSGLPEKRRQGRVLECEGRGALPVYGDVVTFAGIDANAAFIHDQGAAAGFVVRSEGQTVARIGYDLFEEVRFLLAEGQPARFAHVPTLDRHIQILRDCILNAGIALIELAPVPFGQKFIVCLTHDIDFAGIRRHRFDHTMWGFVYRATFGAVINAIRGRLSIVNMLKCWKAVASLPFVFVGWVKDFWDPFAWYLAVEEGLPATYFLIPFKGRTGEKVPGRHASRRAAPYDLEELSESTTTLLARNYELGVHGVDAWHNVRSGQDELERIAGITRSPSVGIRMHWLLNDAATPSALEQAGYFYDSTCGYNETVGYRAGTAQVFRYPGTRTLLELPMHIQDGALFFPERLHLSEPEAEGRCQALVDHAKSSGGVLTVLWHDRSHAAERFWGDFYAKFVKSLRSLKVWFASGWQVVNWFSKRRNVSFASSQSRGVFGIRLVYDGEKVEPPLTVRIYQPQGSDGGPKVSKSTLRKFVDLPWDGTIDGIDQLYELGEQQSIDATALPRAANV
jgi:hypothetical protein